VSLDGSTLDVADERANDQAFGRPGASRGQSAYPQLRFVSLVENGTHVLFGTQMGGYGTGEPALAKGVLPWLRPDMLCLADRGMFSYELWNQARATGAELLWRIKKNLVLPSEKGLPDGSYLSRIYPSPGDRRRGLHGVVVRVIDYQLEGVADYRLITTILDPGKASAPELAALYHERWEIDTALDELKTHLRGARIVLRSKRPDLVRIENPLAGCSHRLAEQEAGPGAPGILRPDDGPLRQPRPSKRPDLVRQEFYGLMMAHFASRGLMHEAALKADEDPDRLSFLHAVRVIRRKLPIFPTIPPRGEGGVP